MVESTWQEKHAPFIWINVLATVIHTVTTVTRQQLIKQGLTYDQTTAAS